jgi:hypothetical protein
VNFGPVRSRTSMGAQLFALRSVCSPSMSFFGKVVRIEGRCPVGFILPKRQPIASSAYALRLRVIGCWHFRCDLAAGNSYLFRIKLAVL